VGLLRWNCNAPGGRYSEAQPEGDVEAHALLGEVDRHLEAPHLDHLPARTSIICQLGFKDRTDLTLLYDSIDPSMEEREFFLRKGIGWALREYAKTDPHEVIRYVTLNKDRLSPLSRREALRNVVKAGLLDAIP